MFRLSQLFRGKRRALPFKLLFSRFRQLLDHNTRVLQLFADGTEKLGGEFVFDRQYIATIVNQVFDLVGKIAYDLNSIADQKYSQLYEVLDRLRAEAQGELAGHPVVSPAEICIPFDQIDEGLSNLVGGKAAHLGAIRNRLQIPMPDGFVITTYAYLRVVEHNTLEPIIDRALAQLAAGNRTANEEICEHLRTARIPADVRKAICRATESFAKGKVPVFFAVRSSAIGEDEDLSFAGQYRTVLQVRPDVVLDAYRSVLSSLYSREAIAYRQASGLPAKGLMAVACMLMIDATTGGVVYTLDPNRPQSGNLLIGATPGLASRAVQGGQSMSQLTVSRQPSHQILERRHADFDDKVVGRASGGLETVPLDPDAEPGEVLADADVQKLADLSLRIERYFKQPQDIEWTRDKSGSINVLQVRRLRITDPATTTTQPAFHQALQARKALLEHQGCVACRGIAAGRVFVVHDDADLARFPEGGVLVARRASPRLVCAIPRASAVLTDIGSPIGHMAALAREFRVPTIVDCGDATTRLPGGEEVTVDADDNVVYAGRLEELLSYQLVAESGLEDAPEYRLLRRLLRRMTTLTLIDPQAESFRPQRCRTVHDVIRFAHEKAVEELIDLHLSGKGAGGEVARRLDCSLAIGLHVIDIGGGLDAALVNPSSRIPITVETIRSAPMRALLAGMMTKGVWHRQPVAVDMRTFLSSAMTMPANGAVQRNLAVLGEDYVNLSLKLGYHYNMIDAYLSDSRDANHVYFRFVGGASDQERRKRRATMVKEILDRLDFTSRQSSDLVVARMRKLTRAATEERLEAVGRLIGYSRQLDALMHSENETTRYVDAFLRGDYTLE
ncbi:MAG: PEP/pyruvate-binding domain-containing protein [Pseudomonadota bacterium]